MLSRPATTIQNVAPGPPMDTATATPAMLPRPTVPDTAAVSAWKCVTSPGSSGLSYRPLASARAWAKPLNWMARKMMVNSTAPMISQATIHGKEIEPSVTG